jgi:hypothetical protein
MQYLSNINRWWKLKITRRQIRHIINELHPRDVADAGYDEELFDLGDVYADMYKEYRGRKPKGPMFKTHEEAIIAIDELSAALKRKYENEDNVSAQHLEDENEARETQGLMPGEYDIELPKQSGYGRRTESRSNAAGRPTHVLRKYIQRALKGNF